MNNQKVEHGMKTKGRVQSLGMELTGTVLTGVPHQGHLFACLRRQVFKSCTICGSWSLLPAPDLFQVFSDGHSSSLKAPHMASYYHGQLVVSPKHLELKDNACPPECPRSHTQYLVHRGHLVP